MTCKKLLIIHIKKVGMIMNKLSTNGPKYTALSRKVTFD